MGDDFKIVSVFSAAANAENNPFAKISAHETDLLRTRAA